MSSFFYDRNPNILHSIWFFHVYNVHHARLMISSETPYKLAEIIRDTWPQLYRPSKKEPKKKTNN